jgi:hypothetical protein
MLTIVTMSFCFQGILPAKKLIDEIAKLIEFQKDGETGLRGARTYPGST